MHESLFSYNITKPYPYRWFTWLVLLGGLVATVLFSVINLAANGYDPSITYAIDPNETEYPRNPAWFQKRPWSLASKVSSTCQDQILTVGSKFLTNNLGLSYKINNLETNRTKSITSLPYHHDNLHQCKFSLIEFNGADKDVETMNASADLTCMLYEDSLPVSLDIAVSCSIGVDGFTTLDDPAPFRSLNKDTEASLWWGNLLLSIYADVMFNINSTLKLPSGVWIFQTTTRMSAAWDWDDGVVMGIGMGDEIYPDGWISTFGSETPGQWSTNAMVEMSEVLDGYLRPINETDRYIVDAFAMNELAKLFYSMVLTDLGQSVESNLLSFPDRIMAFVNKGFRIWDELAPNIASENFSASDTASRWLRIPDGPAPNNTEEFYKWVRTGIPSVKPAQVSTRYLCQIPKLKSTGSLIVSIIVADLVLLQALWLLVTWIVSFFLERRHPDARYCLGCASQIRSEHPETSAKPPPASSVRSYTRGDMQKGSEATVQLLKPESLRETEQISSRSIERAHTS